MKRILLIIGIVLLALGLLGPGAMAGPPAGSVTSILVDHDGDYIEIKDSGAMLGVTVDYPHHEIHGGNHFYAFINSTLANGGKMLILINTPADDFVHFIYPARASGESHMELWEFTTVSALGSAISSQNRNRNSVNASGTAVTLTPTITGIGNMIADEHWGSGQTIGGMTRSSSEIVLRRSTLYLINAISESANNQIEVIADYYEDSGDAP